MSRAPPMASPPDRRSPAWGRLASYLQSQGFLLYDAHRAGISRESPISSMTWYSTSRERRSTSPTVLRLAEGQIWDRSSMCCRRQAAAGVEVRIIFDDSAASPAFRRLPPGPCRTPAWRWRCSIQSTPTWDQIYFNYRDHRKVAVIDGVHAHRRHQYYR